MTFERSFGAAWTRIPSHVRPRTTCCATPSSKASHRTWSVAKITREEERGWCSAGQCGRVTGCNAPRVPSSASRWPRHVPRDLGPESLGFGNLARSLSSRISVDHGGGSLIGGGSHGSAFDSAPDPSHWSLPSALPWDGSNSSPPSHPRSSVGVAGLIQEESGPVSRELSAARLPSRANSIAESVFHPTMSKYDSISSVLQSVIDSSVDGSADAPLPESRHLRLSGVPDVGEGPDSSFLPKQAGDSFGRRAPNVPSNRPHRFSGVSLPSERASNSSNPDDAPSRDGWHRPAEHTSDFESEATDPTRRGSSIVGKDEEGRYAGAGRAGPLGAAGKERLVREIPRARLGPPASSGAPIGAGAAARGGGRRSPRDEAGDSGSSHVSAAPRSVFDNYSLYDGSQSTSRSSTEAGGLAGPFGPFGSPIQAPRSRGGGRGVSRGLVPAGGSADTARRSSSTVRVALARDGAGVGVAAFAAVFISLPFPSRLSIRSPMEPSGTQRPSTDRFLCNHRSLRPHWVPARCSYRPARTCRRRARETPSPTRVATLVRSADAEGRAKCSRKSGHHVARCWFRPPRYPPNPNPLISFSLDSILNRVAEQDPSPPRHPGLCDCRRRSIPGSSSAGFQQSSRALTTRPFQEEGLPPRQTHDLWVGRVVRWLRGSFCPRAETVTRSRLLDPALVRPPRPRGCKRQVSMRQLARGGQGGSWTLRARPVSGPDLSSTAGEGPRGSSKRPRS